MRHLTFPLLLVLLLEAGCSREGADCAALRERSGWGSRPQGQYCDLTGANLAYTDLSGADFTGADLSRADLTKANLSGAILTGAKMTDTIVDRTNFMGAFLKGADMFDLMKVGDADWRRATCPDGHVLGDGNFAGGPFCGGHFLVRGHNDDLIPQSEIDPLPLLLAVDSDDPDLKALHKAWYRTLPEEREDVGAFIRKTKSALRHQRPE